MTKLVGHYYRLGINTFREFYNTPSLVFTDRIWVGQTRGTRLISKSAIQVVPVNIVSYKNNIIIQTRINQCLFFSLEVKLRLSCHNEVILRQNIYVFFQIESNKLKI